MAYELIWHHRGVIKRFFRQMSGEDLIQAGIAIEESTRFDDLRYIVNDCLAVHSWSISAADVDYVSAIDAAAAYSNPRIHIAVVTDSEAIANFARQYAESACKPYPLAVFSSTQAAQDWLHEKTGYRPADW